MWWGCGVTINQGALQVVCCIQLGTYSQPGGSTWRRWFPPRAAAFLQIYSHLQPYLDRGFASPAYPPAARCFAEMAALLRRCGDQIGTHLWLCAAICLCQSQYYTEKQLVPAMRQLGDALVTADHVLLDRQLLELQGGAASSSDTSSTMPLLTTRRLAYNCYQYALEASYTAIHEEDAIGYLQVLSAQSVRRMAASPLAAAAIYCAEAVQQLEPRSPPSLRAAADAKSYATTAGGDPVGACAAAVPMYLDAAEEAQRQRYHMLAVLFSCAALTKCGGLLASPSGALLSRDTTQSVLSAFQKAEAEYLGQVKRLLPAKWQEAVAGAMDFGSRAVPLLQRFLAGDVGRESQMEAMMSNMSLVSKPPNMDARCSGCGEEAAGLRKCARCRQAGYCR